MKVAIIGAGISGLALAYYLQKMGVAYDLFEANKQVGGKIQSIKVNDYLLELGPNALHNSPEIDELIRDLKLENEILPVTPAGKEYHIFQNGASHKFPASTLSFLLSSYLPKKVKYRLLQEKNIPFADIANETVVQFFERRFGSEIVKYAIEPFIRATFAGDPKKLLIEKFLPAIKKLEKEHGSVLKGLIKQKEQLTPPNTFSFVNGSNTLPQAIADKLVSLHLAHRVEIVTRNQGKFILTCSSNGDHDSEEYDLLVLALPAHQAAELLHFTYPGMAAALLNVTCPPMAVVHTVYNRHEVGHKLNGFGALHNKAETTFSTGSIWNSSAFDGRCRPHEAMFTTFIGGSRLSQDATTDQNQLMLQIHQELCHTYSITSEKPIFQHMHLWPYAIPQYDIYIEDAHQMAKKLEQENVFIAANWQSGVSVSHCIYQAKVLAHKINLFRI